MTEEAEKAKNWDMLQQHRDCKARLSRLTNELKLIADGWREMAGYFYDCFNTFAVDDERIRVLRPKPGDKPGMNEVASLPFASIDPESMRCLLADLEETKKTLAELDGQVRALGISL